MNSHFILHSNQAVKESKIEDEHEYGDMKVDINLLLGKVNNNLTRQLHTNWTTSDNQ